MTAFSSPLSQGMWIGRYYVYGNALSCDVQAHYPDMSLSHLSPILEEPCYSIRSLFRV